MSSLSSSSLSISSSSLSSLSSSPIECHRYHHHNLIIIVIINVFFTIISIITGGIAREQGGRHPPQMMKKIGVLETRKSAMKSIHRKAALKWQVQVLFSVWRRAYIQKGVCLYKGCGQKISCGIHPLTPATLSDFILDGTSTLAITGSYRSPTLS